MATNTYDALIVGSGITGGWAAKELTEKGLNVLVLEAGRTIVPEKDYVEHVPSWELKYRGWDERSSGRRSGDDDDDRRGGSRSRDDEGHGGWFGDSRGHAQAARRGWQARD